MWNNILLASLSEVSFTLLQFSRNLKCFTPKVRFLNLLFDRNSTGLRCLYLVTCSVFVASKSNRHTPRPAAPFFTS